jgi:hypothetical protein
MPEEVKRDDLIDVGEADEKATEINLDDKGEPEKKEAPKEEKIEVEEVAQPEEKKEGGEVKEEKKEEVKDEKKEELEKYSEGVQKRIAKLTRKMREAERQKEEAVVYAQSVKKDKEDLENKFSRLDKSYVSEFESRVKTNMKAAKQALKTAIESQNVEGQVTAQEQIATLTMDAARLNALKAAETSKPKEKDVNITPQQYRPHVTPDPMAEDWATRNTWFGNNSAMTYTAFDIHKKLVEEEGFDPKSTEYYNEVDKRIRLEFPHKFGKMDETSTEREKPSQNVASAKRSANTGRRKTVKLTPSQVAIAKRLGVPLEDYAKQLKITEGV